MEEAVDGSHGGCFVGEHLAPLAEGLVCGDYVESRVKLPGCVFPNGASGPARPESGLRVSVDPPGAG